MPRRRPPVSAPPAACRSRWEAIQPGVLRRAVQEQFKKNA
jgi:hypothetical protein